jgi:phage terminase small subunit
MTSNLTPKQERFAQKYIETGNATEAYYAAYDAAGSKPVTANRRAKELLDNGKIAARVRALQEIHQKRHEVTVDSITKELDESRIAATADKQHSVAVAATMGKAKIHGLVTDRGELSGPNGGPIPITGVSIYVPDNGRDKRD